MSKAQKASPITESPASIPTGTVAFLFTDIEGSTKRWDQYHDAMRAAVARHDSLVRATLEQYGGYIFKTVGDAFCAAFHEPHRALRAAIATQLALNQEDFSAINGLRVRMGMHVGTADERDSDYFGPTVNRVARLMSIGHGGQVLVSEAVRNVIENGLPENASLVDLGLRRLKDLMQPEHVWQLTMAGLPSDFAPLTSLDTRPNNLPIQATPLLGREHELDTVKGLSASHRLCTLSGAGGVGKTRLALQVGADLIDRYEHGVWIADLAPISDGRSAPSVIAQALAVHQSGDSVEASIHSALKRRELLLILDNCEHLLDAISPLAESILKTCPNVRVLATTRQPLGIAGECVYRLPSLSVPDAASTVTVQAAQDYGAMALFVERATAADSRFALTDDTASIVAEICRRLDGIPLAIELAAARVRVLSLPNLASRLNERFKILTGGNRTALPRQKTLGALIDWSYALLSLPEQMLFNRLGIFAGSFSLDAASTVCEGDPIEAVDILDLLSSLTDKSLVVADTSSARERFRLLESTRAYALEKLSSAGERDALARRHAEYFLGIARAFDDLTGTNSTLKQRAEEELDLDNSRAALDWALTRGNDVNLGGELAAMLHVLWRTRGMAVEGRSRLNEALERVDVAKEPAVAAHVWAAVGWLSSGAQMFDGLQRAVRLFESSGDDRLAARARRALPVALYQMGRFDEAAQLNAQALEETRALGMMQGVANLLDRQGSIEWSRGHSDVARQCFAESLAVYQSLGDDAGVSRVNSDLAELEFMEGRADVAILLTKEALEIDLRGKDHVSLAITYNNAAVYSIAIEDLAEAHRLAREGLRWARQARVESTMAWGIQHLSLLAALGGDVRRAASLLGYVDRQLIPLCLNRHDTERWSWERLMTALRGQLSDDEIASLAGEGATWSEDRAVDEAMKL